MVVLRKSKGFLGSFISHTDSNPPRSITELNALARMHTDDCIPTEIYLSSADLLLKQARIYYTEENQEQAYLYFMKYINLVLIGLSQRLGFDYINNRTMIKTCMEALDAVEMLRPTIEAMNESYALYQEEEEKKKQNQPDDNQKLQLAEEFPSLSNDIMPSVEHTATNSPSPYYYNHPQEHQVPLAEIIKYRPSAPTTLPVYNLDTDVDSMDWEHTSNQNSHQDDLHIPKQFQSMPPPPIPPKIELYQRKQDFNNTPPPLPPKLQLFLTTEAKDQRGASKLSDSNDALRVLNIPKGIQQFFLEIARFNTAQNIETCGLLSGKLEHDELHVTSLIIPNQLGTSDTCITKNEEAIFEYQNEHGLMTLGWIHTHPSQSCFLSSVDLHTQCSYQLMLPEAVAIVCSPNHAPDYGIFRITTPNGLSEITNCRVQEPFHPHVSDKTTLYTDCNGHVRLNPNSTLNIIDLRN